MYAFYIMFKESLPTSKSLVIIIFSNVSFSFSLQAWSFYLSCLGIRSVSNSFLYFVWSESQGLWAAAAKSLQLCLTLWNPIDSSPPGSAVPRILQARTLEWVAISFSSAWKWKVKVKSLSHVRLFETPWTVAYPGSSVHGIFQARVLEWIAIAFSVSRFTFVQMDIQHHLLKWFPTGF